MSVSKKLLKKRSSCKDIIVKIDKFMEDCQKPEQTFSIEDITVRKNKLIETYNSYEETQDEILCTNPEQVDDVDVLELYFSTMSKIEKLINKLKSSNTTVDSASDKKDNDSNVRQNEPLGRSSLPTLEIPCFDGSDVSQFTSFFDIFSALIHKNAQLSDVQKLCYLKKYLKGEALEIISSLPITDSSYQNAIDLLNNRFNNKAIIINSHLQHLLEVPGVNVGSAKNLREFVSKVRQQIGCLKNLNQPVEHWDSILIYILSKKLDNFTIKAYQLERDQNEIPLLDSFLSFIEKRAMSLEVASSTTVNNSKLKPKTSVNISTNKGNPSGKNKRNRIASRCMMCNVPDHKIFSCIKFKNLPIRERWDVVLKNNLCKICLNNHTGDCSYKNCILCSSPHNSLLHTDDESPNNALYTRQTVLLGNTKPSQVLLPTALVKIRTANGFVTVKCLLDSCSQNSFITEKLVKVLKLKSFHNELEIVGLSNNNTRVSRSVSLEIHSNVYNYKTKVSLSVVPRITCDLPQYHFNLNNIKIPPNINLADEQFNIPSEIPLLLGADIFFKLLLTGTIKLGPEQPVLQNTLFGYIVSGSIIANQRTNTLLSVTLHSVSKNDEQHLDELITKFWQTETLLDDEKFSSEKEMSETSFVDSVIRIDGRFQVKLPLKVDIENLHLGDSYLTAFKRFQNLEKRFKREPSLFNDYSKFISDYINIGHAKVISLSQYTENSPIYFLAHHPVIREDKSSTKLRVVFDGSMKTNNNISLNDVMYNGDIPQLELFDILINFRTYKYVFICDIKQMFRQILIDPSHRQLQNILWRNNPNESLQCLQLQTVTYGLKASPHLATRCLAELANENVERYPLASAAILNNCYIDDFLCGSNCLEIALKTRFELVELLGSAHLKLHKWCANHPALLVNIPNENLHFGEIKIDEENSVTKTLGLVFDTHSDYFKLYCPETSLRNHQTKRSVLSFISKFYDPLGLIGPVIVTAKIIIQKLWERKLSWDEPLPEDLAEQWRTFALQLISMPSIKIDRSLRLEDSSKRELIGYCDSSSYAYGAVIYSRVIHADGTVTISLLCSKSRVAPLNKRITIPKLELNSAALLSRLIHRVYILMEAHVQGVYLYSDSTIALSWINSNYQRFNVYVANRVKLIQELTNRFQWAYIKSEDNPADCLSRGVEPHSIHFSSLWWQGPSYLSDPNFKHEGNFSLSEDIPEVQTLLNVKQHETLDLFSKYSTLPKMQRITALVLRFIHNLKNKDKLSGTIKVFELKNALTVIIRQMQHIEFHTEISNLKEGKPISSNLKSLHPFLDKDDILRVGGRLHNAPISFSRKHPIILAQKCHLTKLIIINEHLTLLHAGPKLVLANLRQRFWLINGNRETKRVLYKCVTCFRLKAKCAEQLMGSLPANRVTIARVFQKVGVDYGGPFTIKQSRIRKTIISKAYIVLFVCFVTKAIHIELASDMTTETFLAVLKRFISRRGRPTDIYSDNGSTFRGANNKLNDLFKLLHDKTNQTIIENMSASLGIQWSFIPSYSPVFGGLWEAGIKSAKHHLKRVVGNSVLTYEELNTVVIQVEGILNSRPLCQLTDDPSDIRCLTPGHFLTGAEITGIPEPEITVPTNRLKFWKHCTFIQQSFWKSWSRDYLVQLQNRPKWQTERPNICEGLLVIVREDNLPPLEWKLARVSKVVKGSDDKVRVVELKTKHGTCITSLSKICVLPIYDSINSSDIPA